MKSLIQFIREENGMTVSEYALITGMVSFAAAAAMMALGIKFLEILPL